MTQDFEKRLYVQNVDQWNRKLNKERFSDRKLDVKIINHGIVLPARKMEVGYAGGVCDNNFNFVAGYTRKDPAKGVGGGGFMLIPRMKCHAKILLLLMRT